MVKAHFSNFSLATLTDKSLYCVGLIKLQKGQLDSPNLCSIDSIFSGVLCGTVKMEKYQYLEYEVSAPKALGLAHLVCITDCVARNPIAQWL